MDGITVSIVLGGQGFPKALEGTNILVQIHNARKSATRILRLAVIVLPILGFSLRGEGSTTISEILYPCSCARIRNSAPKVSPLT